jgi:hypothetical protein
MKHYESSVPRLACGIAAVVMTTVTVGLFVVLPSMMEPEGQAFSTAQVATTPTMTERHTANGSV